MNFDTINWGKAAEQFVGDLPPWVFVAAGSAVLIALLVVGYLVISKSSAQQAKRDEEHREAVSIAREKDQPLPPKPLHMDTKPLIGGFAVSLNGLWHFAQDTVNLSFLFAIGFVSMFDVLEIRLFSQMFKMANDDPRRRWTRSLKVMRATAWGLVFASAAANVVHAPNLWAAPFLAAMPIGAAWVIYVPLHSALGETELAEDEKRPEGRKPGPLLLVGLVWRKLWAWVFGLFGLDVNDRADEMVRRARAREAADASYELRVALLEKKDLEQAVQSRDGRGAKQEARSRLKALTRKVDRKIRPKAQNALEQADTHLPSQGLQLMQRMAWLTNADDVALLDYGPDSPAMEKLEQLNIAANADFIDSSKRAKEADARAEEAEEARRTAEEAVEAARAQLADLAEQLERSRSEAQKAGESVSAEIEAEQLKLVALRTERELLESSEASTGQLYQRTSRELEEIRAQLTGAQDVARLAREEVVRMEGSNRALTERLEVLVGERDKLVQEADDVLEQARQDREKAVRLEERLRALEALQKVGVPAAGPKRSRIEARINGGGGAGETRQRIRELLQSMTAEERTAAAGPRNSRRELARHLIDRFQLDLGLDAVRGHIGEIEKEDQQAAQARGEVPAPRSEDEVETEHETATV
ncbi:DUF2637 domain-containing protein [Streptomyces sp. SS]|uniref:DUF2637 domain-containing protein n=1 Tax=Streptomyces sp. SS TaxID=260742 RepID=UPI0002F5C9D4|nr:DUF2637 domain-containing protein [Streptomyces sp. SS]